MYKRNYITLEKNERLYRLCSDDIKGIYKQIKRKTPVLPPFEIPTSDESLPIVNVGVESS